MAGKIKNPHKATQGKSVTVVPLVEIQHFEHPIFCLRYLHKDFGIGQCDPEEKKSLIEKLATLSSMTWQAISQAYRHGLGYEKIARESLNISCPPFITEEVTHLLAFRFQGMKPFLGHRNRFILHLIFIDRTFNVYNHG